MERVGCSIPGDEREPHGEGGLLAPGEDVLVPHQAQGEVHVHSQRYHLHLTKLCTVHY